MITGFNTDVDYQERVFHVQTEDRGMDHPVVESLIYCGGEILASRRNSYADLAESGGYSEDEILRRMESQHQSMIREIFNGKYDGDEPRPFGHSIVTNRSLDEVVLEFLALSGSLHEITLELVDEQELVEGTRPTLRMRVVEPGTERPVDAADVTVRLISTRGQPRELFAGPTDQEGFIEASFSIPTLADANTAIVCEAEAAGLRAEIRQLVQKPARSSPDIA